MAEKFINQTPITFKTHGPDEPVNLGDKSKFTVKCEPSET